MPPTTPLSDEGGEGERERAGCSPRLMVHTEREHRPTVAVLWFICHLVLMTLQTAGTHTCCHGIFLYQGLCWFVDPCVLFSCERMHECNCVCMCVILLVLYTLFRFVSICCKNCLYLAAYRSVLISAAFVSRYRNTALYSLYSTVLHVLLCLSVAEVTQTARFLV